MATKTSSPRVFIEESSSIAKKLASTARCVTEFKNSMSTAADLMNTAIASANSETGGSATQTRRELRSSRENFMKTLACSATLVDRFNKLLRYADMDDTWKSKMVDTASRGDYKSFSAYVTQLKRFLDQLDRTYQDFVQACSNAEAQSMGLPMVEKVTQAAPSPPIFAQEVNIFGLRVSLPLLAGVALTGLGTWIGMSYIMNFKTAVSFLIGLAVAILVFLAGSYLRQAWWIRHSSSSQKKPPLAIQYHGYNSIRGAASKINSSGLEFRKALNSIESDEKVEERIGVAKFSSALDVLLAELRKAYDTVNSCYEELDTGINVLAVSHY